MKCDSDIMEEMEEIRSESVMTIKPAATNHSAAEPIATGSF